MSAFKVESYRHLEGYDSHIIRDLVDHLAPMKIDPTEIRGSVCVIGCGSIFPERALIFNPQQECRRILPRLSAYVCDCESGNSPVGFVDSPFHAIQHSKFPIPKLGHTYYTCRSSWSLFNEIPDKVTFDTVLMLRGVNTGMQITQNDLVGSISSHLNPDGLVILSGGRFPDNFSDAIFKPLHLVRQTHLPNYSGVYSFTNNWGVILRKQ